MGSLVRWQDARTRTHTRCTDTPQTDETYDEATPVVLLLLLHTRAFHSKIGPGLKSLDSRQPPIRPRKTVAKIAMHTHTHTLTHTHRRATRSPRAVVISACVITGTAAPAPTKGTRFWPLFANMHRCERVHCIFATLVHTHAMRERFPSFTTPLKHPLSGKSYRRARRIVSVSRNNDTEPPAAGEVTERERERCAVSRCAWILRPGARSEHISTTTVGKYMESGVRALSEHAHN